MITIDHAIEILKAFRKGWDANSKCPNAEALDMAIASLGCDNTDQMSDEDIYSKWLWEDKGSNTAMDLIEMVRKDERAKVIAEVEKSLTDVDSWDFAMFSLGLIKEKLNKVKEQKNE